MKVLICTYQLRHGTAVKVALGLLTYGQVRHCTQSPLGGMLDGWEAREGGGKW